MTSASVTLTFGVNPLDCCLGERGRYHVKDEAGRILAKLSTGIYAYDYAGNLSDLTPDVTFSVIDTRDGSVYGAYRNGEDVPTETLAHTAATEILLSAGLFLDGIERRYIDNGYEGYPAFDRAYDVIYPRCKRAVRKARKIAAEQLALRMESR